MNEHTKMLRKNLEGKTPPDGQIMYGEKRIKEGSIVYTHMYKNTLAVKMCGTEPKDIVKLSVRAARSSDESSIYWGWWCFKQNEYAMIWPTRLQSDMCFTYGVKAEEKMGKGIQLNFIVEEVKKT